MTKPAATVSATTAPRFAVSFEPDVRRVPQMRRITAAFLRHHSLPALADTALLVVSELVTNAVLHGRGAIGLRMSPCHDGLRIEVSDGNPAPARPRRAAADDENGRGLLILDALAEDWGVSEDGTTTWCTLALSGGRP